jgi:hypothetical protein
MPWMVNRFEGVQWTMVYEIRGSMSVFLVLIITSSFTSFYRTTALVLLTAWSIVFDRDPLLAIPFYLGTLLADLSLVIDKNRSTSTLDIRPKLSPTRIVREHWPIMLAIFSLFLAGYPPNSPDQTAWSQFLLNCAELIIPRDDGISPTCLEVLTRN